MSPHPAPTRRTFLKTGLSGIVAAAVAPQIVPSRLFDQNAPSKQVTLGAGDLIYTGTPAGVGPVVPGDLIAAHIDGLPSLTITIAPLEA